MSSFSNVEAAFGRYVSPAIREQLRREQAVTEFVRPGALERLIEEGRTPHFRTVRVDGVTQHYECYVPLAPLENGDTFGADAQEFNTLEVIRKDGTFKGETMRYDLTPDQYTELTARAAALLISAAANPTSTPQNGQ